MAVSDVEDAPKPGRGARALEALNVFQDPNYRWYWLGSFAYYTGLHMELTARAQLAYDLTGQAFLLGVAALSLGLPSTLMSIMGGALADRIPKRSMLLAAQVVLASSGLLLCLLLATGLIEFWHVVALGVVRGLTTGFSLPARLSMVSEVVKEEQFLKAYGIYYVALNTMRIGGPAIAGVTIGLTGGPMLAFLLIAIAHSIGLLALLPVFSRKRAEAKRHTSIFQDIGGMFAFAFQSPTILILLGAALGVTFFATSTTPLLPIFAEEVFQAPRGVGLAMLQGSQGLGGLLGSMAIAALGGMQRKPLLLLICGTLQSAALILFANAPWLSVGVLMMVVVGVFQAAYTTLTSTLFQLNAPPEMRGRAMSLYMLSHASQPIGVLPIGFFGDLVGVQATVTVSASLLISYMLAVLFLFPGFRKQRV